MSLAVQLQALVSRLGKEFQEINQYSTGTKTGSLASLNTTAKGNLIAAINEVDQAVKSLDASKLVIDDSAPSVDKSYSSSKVDALLSTLKADILGDGEIDSVLDTIKEIAAYAEQNRDLLTQLQDLSQHRVSTKAGQSLTSEQRTNVFANIGLDTEISRIDTDFDSVREDITNTNFNLEKEENARLAADVATNNRVTTLTSTVADNKTDIEAKVETNKTKIETLETSLATQVSTITTAFKAADKVISDSLADEVQDRTDAVAALSTKLDERAGLLQGLIDSAATEYRAGDDALSTRIDDEVADRKSEITRVEGLVAVEATDRSNAILAERARYEAKDTEVVAKVDAVKASVGDTTVDLVALFESALSADHSGD